MDYELFRSSHFVDRNSLYGNFLRIPFDDDYSVRCIVWLCEISFRIGYRHRVVELSLVLGAASREWRSAGAPTND